MKPNQRAAMSENQKPFYLVTEGIDGTGKSTLLKALAKKLSNQGIDCIRLAEPSEGKYGKRIRAELAAENPSLAPQAWLELFEADRREQIETQVRPALDAGKWVLQDRSFYSTAAYQGAQGADLQDILQRNRSFAIEPDLVLILDLSPEKALKRVHQRQSMQADAFEQLDYLHNVRELFLSLKEPHLHILNADMPQAEVLQQALQLLTKYTGISFDNRSL